MTSSVLNLPESPAKPRERAITAATDDGIGLSTFRDAVELNAEYLDYVKFGWGSSIITNVLSEKIAILKLNDVDFWIGGTAFEIAILQKREAQFIDWVEALGATHFEISDGTIDLQEEKKLGLIEILSKRFRVLSEIGSKDVDHVTSPREWIRQIRNEKEAGAWKIIAEGRESGTSGIYRNTGEIREGLINEICESGINIDELIFEAPQKAQQVWLIKRLSRMVNFGNIPLEQVLNVQALRLGLRADTAFLHEQS